MLSPSDFNSAVPQFTNGEYASNPINPQYIAEPDAENYNRGTEPLQTLPAQWWNWFLNKFTGRFNKVNIYVKNIFNELTQLLSLVSETPSGTEGSPTIGQLKDMFENKYPNYLALLMYPVGSIYWTGKAPDDGGDPNVLFGGTWVQIKGKFVWAKGDSDTLNATGGAKTVTLTTDQIPSHNHSFTPSGTISVTTNPTFSGTAVNTDSKGSHSHTTNSQSTSTSGGMSDHSSVNFTIINNSQRERGTPISFNSSSMSSLTYHNDNQPKTYFYAPNGNLQKSDTLISPNVNNAVVVGSDYFGYYSGTLAFAHTHSIAHTHGTDSQGAHTHSVTASGTISGGAYKFTGSAGTTENKGGGQAHENMPPYIVKYCWERTA
jgi:microcystin-dependent protein